MPREYTCTFENVAVSAAQDLFQVTGASGKMLLIQRVAVNASNTTLPTAQMISLRCRYLPATVTNGSGGSTATPAKQDPGDSAASFTCLANNTTKATTSGTAITLKEQPVHVYAGLDYSWRSGTEPCIGPSEAFVFELLSTVSGTVNLSGEINVLEYGG